MHEGLEVVPLVAQGSDSIVSSVNVAYRWLVCNTVLKSIAARRPVIGEIGGKG